MLNNPDRRNATATQQQTNPRFINPNVESGTKKAWYLIKRMASSEKDRHC